MTSLLCLLLSAPAGATDVDVGGSVTRGSARMVGMGGAYRAIAEGPQAHRVNPAAIVVAPTYEDPDTWRWNGIFIVRSLAPLRETLDVSSQLDRPFPNAEASFGALARRGIHAGVLRVDLSTRFDAETGQGVLLTEIAAGYGIALLDEQLHLGVIPGVLLVRTDPASRRSVAALPTFGLGARMDLPDAPVRLGASLYTPGGARIDDPDVGGVRIPWEAGVGAAWRRGRMTHGPRHGTDDADPPPAWTGAPWFVQVALDATMVGPLTDVTAIDAWNGGRVEGTDQPARLELALGVETAPLPYHLRVRTGVYNAARPPGSLPRRIDVHGTFGLDVAVLEWPRGRWRWRLSPAVDVSGDGVRLALGLGLW